MYYSNKKNGCGHYKSNDNLSGAVMREGGAENGCACCIYFFSHNCAFTAAKLSG